MKITQTSNEHLKKAVMDAVVKAYKLAGYNVPTPRDLAEIVNMMADDLRKYFRNNDTADIATAFERGALGDFGEYQGLSVARFHQWMKTFNGKATNQQAADDEPPQQPQPPRDRVADAHSLINSMYSTWLEKGFTIVPASVVLPWLIRENKIPEIRRKAQMAREQAAATLASQAMQKRSRFQKISDYIKQNQATEEDSIILDLYFSECKANNMEAIYQ